MDPRSLALGLRRSAGVALLLAACGKPEPPASDPLVEYVLPDPRYGSCDDVGAVTAAPQRSAATADRVVYGDVHFTNLGYRVVVADLLAGGASEVAFTALDLGDNLPGYVGVLAGDEAVLTEAAALWTRHPSWGAFGYHLGAPDLDGDGAVDLVIGSQGAGGVEVLWGPIEPAPVGPVPAGALLVESAGEPGGGPFAFLGDWDGDGRNEVAVGGYRGAASFVAVVEVSRDLPLDAYYLPETAIAGPDTEGDAFGRVLAAADIDGDGTLELLTGDYGTGSGGEVRVFSAASGSLAVDDARTVIRAWAPALVGFSVMPLGDVNGDHLPDLGLGLQSDPGLAPLFPAPIAPGNLTVDRAAIAVDAELPDDLFGGAMVSADFDGDGWDDLAIGASGDPNEDAGPGVVYLFHGPINPRTTARTASLVLVGACDRERFGWSLAAGDVDGDGVPDLVVGAPYNDLEADKGGAIYLFSGASLALD